MCRVPRHKGKHFARTKVSSQNPLKLIKPYKENALAQTRLSEAQSELDGRDWRMYNVDVALSETGMKLLSPEDGPLSGESIVRSNSRVRRDEKHSFAGRSCKKSLPN